MKRLILVGVFVLLYQQTFGKPINRKAKSKTAELVREKRDEVDEDEKSSEMQKFMLDLSSKEDMSRLKERFRSGTTHDIENDAEYRRLRRFSIHDNDDDIEGKSVKSGTEAMKIRSSRIIRDNAEVLSTEKRPLSVLKATSKRSEDETEYFESQLEHLGDHTGSLGGRTKHSEETDDRRISEKESKRSENSTASKDGLSTVNFSDESENNHNLEVDIIRRNIADNETEDSRVNAHHIVSASWQLIHHHPTALLPSLSSVNTTVSNDTTMHSEYLRDDVVDGVEQYDTDNVTEYERTEKSRRKSLVSLVRPVRSFETDYEVRELTEVHDRAQKPQEDDENALVVNTRAIKRDGYIGCYVDQHPNRDLKRLFTVNNLTPDSCRSICKQKGHVYAGVQYGYLCHCGDEYGKYGEAGEHECDSSCVGDEAKKCGGFWRNSVYTSETPDDASEASTERETRSHIDRVIPIPNSEQEEPVHQEITVYLKTEIPRKKQNTFTQEQKDTKVAGRSDAVVTDSKRAKIPTPVLKPATLSKKVMEQPSNVMQANKRTDVNNNAYLHPQTGSAAFVPSSIVLRTLTPSPKRRKYTGFVKLKQNWDDGLQKKTDPKTLILAGNIESAFEDMFASDRSFVKAEVLSLREAAIRDNPDTVHKVVVEFALTFKKEGRNMDEKLKKSVEANSRLGEMPVFADSLDIKEYKSDSNSDEKDEEDSNADEETENYNGEARVKEKRQDGVDAFLEEVFRQI